MLLATEHKNDAKTLKRIGRNVRAFREKRGWSQEQMAEMADVHDRTIGKIERGELNFSVIILIKICKAFGCTPNALVEK